MGVDGQRHGPATSPPGKTRCPLYRRLGGPQGRSGRVQKISPPPGCDPRTVQSVASRYPGPLGDVSMQTEMLATDQWSPQMSKVFFTYVWPFVWIPARQALLPEYVAQLFNARTAGRARYPTERDEVSASQIVIQICYKLQYLAVLVQQE